MPGDSEVQVPIAAASAAFVEGCAMDIWGNPASRERMIFWISPMGVRR